MSHRESFGARLYNGDVSYDFVARQRVWYAISAIVLVVAVGALLLKGLALGIEFRGGSEFQLKSPTVSVEQARTTLTQAGVEGEPIVQTVGGDTLRIETSELTTQQAEDVRNALAEAFDVSPSQVNERFVGPSWGSQITNKAATGLVVFIIGVMLFIWAFFREWRMAVSAITALLHDLVITVGIYALVGFEVTPSTVIGILTILGYSLYDTVVVFDKVRENTVGITGGSRWTYSEAANLAVNQTLIRSINTSVIALLPVAGILFVGAGLMGAGTLKDLSLALFIGIAAGTYSSIFIATPMLADLKEREPAMRALRKRVQARRSSDSKVAVPVGAAKVDESEPVDASDATEAVESAAGDEPVIRSGGGPSRGPRTQPRRTSKNRPSGKRRR